MFPFLLNIFLALAWAALIGEFTPLNVLAGAVLGYLMMWIVQDVADSKQYVRKVPRVIALALFFFKELLVANLMVASTVIANRPKLNPGIIAVPLDVKSDIEITLLANMITLTPGTWSLDVTPDKRILYVHIMHIEDIEETRQSIKQGFERRIREVFEDENQQRSREVAR
jgi:multicomponent Na+:H+ antiporter subunit E